MFKIPWLFLTGKMFSHFPVHVGTMPYYYIQNQTKFWLLKFVQNFTLMHFKSFSLQDLLSRTCKLGMWPNLYGNLFSGCLQIDIDIIYFLWCWPHYCKTCLGLFVFGFHKISYMTVSSAVQVTLIIWQPWPCPSLVVLFWTELYWKNWGNEA